MLLGCVCTGFVWSYLVVRVQPAGLAFVVGLCPLTRCECMIILDAIYTRSTSRPRGPPAPRAASAAAGHICARPPVPQPTPDAAARKRQKSPTVTLLYISYISSVLAV